MLYLTNKRITMIIIVLLIIIPLLNAYFWYDFNYSYENDLTYLVQMNNVNSSIANSYIDNYLVTQYQDFYLNLL